MSFTSSGKIPRYPFAFPNINRIKNPKSFVLYLCFLCGFVSFCVVLCSLQQWFEYCSSKKQSCPVCKQGCKANDACRLYFQSVGDSSDAVVTQKHVDSEEDAGVLRREVKRLESKVLGLNSVLEGKSKELAELQEEVILIYLFLFIFCFLFLSINRLGLPNFQFSFFISKY